jgi:putative transposase
MPTRNIPLVTNQVYHIMSRGVAKQPIFQTVYDYEHLLFTLRYYQFCDTPTRLSFYLSLPSDQRSAYLASLEKSQRIVNVICYALMPNHFHLLVSQEQENGISLFMRKSMNSYCRFYNTKHKRKGPLFQGVFKAVRIESDEQLLHVSRYIHLNPLVSCLSDKNNFLKYPWTSLSMFVDQKGWVSPDLVLGQFKTRQSYLKFVMDQENYGKKMELIKHLALDND